MKKLKTKHYAAIAAVVVLAAVLVCLYASMRVPYGWLPESSKAFVGTYFPGASCVYAERDWEDGRREYEVKLSDGTEIDFYATGEWKKVDCGYSFLPAGIVPERIAQDVAARYADVRIHKVKRERGGYEVSIGNGLKLIYSTDGTFIRQNVF